jgi:dihydroflavonol-4-reductase
MKVAVTGASGHIGNNVCRELLNRGHQVTALVRQDTTALNGLNVECISGDVSDKDSLDILLHDADAVCHVAGLISISGSQKGLVQEINIRGTENVIESAIKNKVKNMVHLSSVHAHQSPGVDGVMDEQSPYSTAKNSAYDLSKATAEVLVINAREKGLSTTILNPTAVIGPSDFKPSLTGKLILRLCKRQIPALTPLGFNWVDVRDVSWAVAESIDHGIENEKMIISGNWHSFAEFAKIVEQISGTKAPRFVSPFWLSKMGVPMISLYSKIAQKEPLYTYESIEVIQHGCKNISSARAVELLNHKARPLNETLRDSVAWFKANNQL